MILHLLGGELVHFVAGQTVPLRSVAAPAARAQSLNALSTEVPRGTNHPLPLPMIPARAGRLRLAPSTWFPPSEAPGSWPTPSLRFPLRIADRWYKDKAMPEDAARLLTEG